MGIDQTVSHTLTLACALPHSGIGTTSRIVRVTSTELLRRIILSCTNPGDVVLDPFAGAGTAAVVASQHGRNSINIEHEEYYIAILKTRLRIIAK